MISLNLSAITRWGLNLLALLAGVLALKWGQSIFLPAIIALLLAAVLWPVVRWLHQALRLPWTLSCLAIVAGLVAINIFLSFGLFVSMTRLIGAVPDPRDETGQQKVYDAVRKKMEKMVKPWELDKEYFPEEAKNSPAFQWFKETIQRYMPEALLEVAYYSNAWLWAWILIMFFLLFMLIEGPMLTSRVVEIFGPSQEAQERAVQALADMAQSVRKYVVWRTIINFGLALVVGVCYEVVFGLKHPWTWAMVTAVLCYVPYLGPIAAGVPPVLDAFITADDPWMALHVIIFYLFIITIEGYVVFPLVMGRSMELNATTVLLACLFWDLVWGTTGLFLAMPLMAGIKAILVHVPDGLAWANLMSIHKIKTYPGEQKTSDGIQAPEEATILMRAEDAGLADSNSRSASEQKKEESGKAAK